ncbi:S-adenosylmethionine decarboxylase, core [Pseudocohnilembus persalinus]|uniref:S-adenosylmethionine decarboxylase, core n=1 Tax=Pseudocohnilembus persalinus TaxID=266149 RepID=A0A0V0QS02_PSEPJ|nr:S-adenosylmethionine decarboxylase, core [Pseudocohnilembus persalinus]|eukprot:KRX05046.1 S-adenosylmethionine decarboxylase, core [Pseudocohnilembus persalinus]
MDSQNNNDKHLQEYLSRKQKSNNLPNLGKHLILDFVGTKINVNDYDLITNILTESLKKCGIEILQTTFQKFEPYGLTELFLLDHGHLTIHTWPENDSCAIDFYTAKADNFSLIKKVEEYICDQFGWESCTSTLVVPRGKFSKLLTNDSPAKSEIYNQVTLVHREKSQYQDIRIYDTLNMGRILILDGYVQITDDLEDHYTVDMTKSVIDQDKDYENVLIIGGGDLLIARYILTNYPRVKKLTLAELDGRVIECVKTYFKFGEVIKQTEEKINVVLQDGASFVQDEANKGKIYDGVIIDSSDSWDKNSPAYSLTTVEFYKNIKKILSKGAKFVQQLSDMEKIEGFNKNFDEAGLKDHKIYMCSTPFYGEDLPLGIITNNE